MKPMPLHRNLLLWLSVVLAAALVTIPTKAPAQGEADQAPSGPTKLLRFADISKDKVVFAYAGDLWIASREGGAAHRLTSHIGDELYPKFSPDGKWIAFTGEYDGNPDVYVISAEGGEPKRLTFHPSNDIVLGWTPDGKDILFRSDRFSAPPGRYTKLFLVSPQGGPARPLQVPRASLTSFSPDGTKIAYLETSQEFRTWKRYRGGWSLPIAIFDLKKNSYEELPKTAGMDLFPMWHGNTIYFISDREGVMNLFSYDLASKQPKKLTDYKEYDIKWPSLGPDAIVYENGGLLYEFNLANGKTRNLPIVVRAEDIEARTEFKNVAQSIGSYSLSPSAARALMEARGNIFTAPAEHGSIRTLTTNHSGIHELNPAWSPDGTSIAYLSDKTGEFELYRTARSFSTGIKCSGFGTSVLTTRSPCSSIRPTTARFPTEVGRRTACGSPTPKLTAADPTTYFFILWERGKSPRFPQASTMTTIRSSTRMVNIYISFPRVTSIQVSASSISASTTTPPMAFLLSP